MNTFDLIIVGAGPVGLATAIAAKHKRMSFKLFEKGVLLNTIFNFPKQMVLYSSPESLEIGSVPFTISNDKPTRDQVLSYYRQVIDTYEIPVELGYSVLSVKKCDVNERLFTLETCDTQEQKGAWRSRNVVIATGCCDHPNFLGIPGEDFKHVSHYFPEAHEFYRKNVVIVGGNNSAAEAALELYRHGARVTLIHRRLELSDRLKDWIRLDIENLIKEGFIKAKFDTHVSEIRKNEVIVEGIGGQEKLPAESVFLLTGYFADLEFLRNCEIQVDPDTNTPSFNPKTFETNVSGLYLAGTVVSGAIGRKVFIENTRFHAKVIIDRIANF